MITFDQFLKEQSEDQVSEMARKFAAMFKGSSNNDFQPIQGSVSFQAKNSLGGTSGVWFREGERNEVEADTAHFTKELANGAYTNGSFWSAMNWVQGMKTAGYDTSKCKQRMGMNMQELEEHLRRYLI